MWRPTRPAPRISHAVVLGLLHGPAELLPISSSGHMTVVPWLLRWDYARLDDELRKSFEVALHAGTAVALLVTLRDEVGDALRGGARSLGLIALATAPAALAGAALERPIERRLGTPATIAVGLWAGSAALALADRQPQLRSHHDADWRDALALGGAQALALIPGVSRNGATLAAGRARRFTRRDASTLSRHMALPVIAGATLLKAVRLRRGGLPPAVALSFGAGAIAAFASTLACARLIRIVEDDRPLLPFAVYRVLLAGGVLARLRTDRLKPAQFAKNLLY